LYDLTQQAALYTIGFALDCVRLDTATSGAADTMPIRFGFISAVDIAPGLPAGTARQGIDDWRVTVWIAASRYDLGGAASRPEHCLSRASGAARTLHAGGR
jgi:hypothetical protein